MKAFFFICFLLVIAGRNILRRLNLRHLQAHGRNVPEEFAAVVDAATLRRAADYTVARDRVSVVESLTGNILVLLFFFGGLLPIYDRWIAGMAESFVLGGWLFFSGLFLFQFFLDAPFSFYRTFVVENRFGFNTMNVRLWCADQVRSFVVGLVVMSLLICGGLALVKASPAGWWIWVWVFLVLLSVFLIYGSPYLIEPLFFQFQPVDRDDLREKIRELMARAGLKVDKVLQVDASRRSRHSNAYFTGIGRVKRIVLFDTLLEDMSDREILAVLAHEAGHWRLGHLRKRLALMAAGGLGILLLVYFMVGGPGRGALLWLDNVTFPARLLLAGFLFSLASFVLVPVSNWFSRRHESQADRFAVDLTGDATGLSRGLIKLAKENLANLHPHPLYAWFYFSHPPVVQRVRKLAHMAGERVPKKA